MGNTEPTNVTAEDVNYAFATNCRFTGPQCIALYNRYYQIWNPLVTLAKHNPQKISDNLKLIEIETPIQIMMNIGYYQGPIIAFNFHGSRPYILFSCDNTRYNSSIDAINYYIKQNAELEKQDTELEKYGVEFERYDAEPLLPKRLWITTIEGDREADIIWVLHVRIE
jgi:hypothetical protein